jgi:TRAP-type uncharacterized transport system substrate-binding protein
MFRCVWLLVFAALCPGLQGCSNDWVTASGSAPARASRSPKVPLYSNLSKAQASRVKVISGEQDSNYPRPIIDLAEIAARGPVRVWPTVSRGPRQDLVDVLNNPEIDVAVVQTDSLEALEPDMQATAREKLRYLFRLPNEELHVLASRDIEDIRQLEGRAVNIDRPGTSTHLTARTVFEKLGIRPDFTTDDQATARNGLKSGEIQAAVVLASRPSSEVLALLSLGQFHLLSVPSDDAIRDYIPSRFTAEDYPNVIEPGGSIGTVAVGRILVVRDWPEGSARHTRLKRLVEAVYGQLDALRQAGFDPGWRNVDPLEPAPGWQRFKPAQDLIDRRDRQARAQ